MENLAYIYKKKGIYRVYTHEKALIHHKELIKNGWIHESTIDSVYWVENKLNKNK